MPRIPVRLVASLGIFFAASAQGDPGSDPTQAVPKAPTLRYVETPAGSELQTAIVRLRHPGSGARVDLVGAVHIADPAYYEALNTRFKDYDAVLFELVGGDGDVEKKLASPPDPDNPIRFFQVLLKNSLGLAFQIDAIDYAAENFVHADMSVREFEESQEASGETLETIMADTFKAYLARGDSGGEGAAGAPDMGELMGIFMGGEDADGLKRGLAQQLGGIDDVIASIDGEDGSVILAGRNATALRKMEEMLAAGKRKLAVFYGAGHLPGMERSLTGELGFERTGIEWIPAWTMPAPEEE